MFANTLALTTKQLLQRFDKIGWLKKFYLAGGTALALQYGHRQSLDLDWFTPHPINVPLLLRRLTAIATPEILNRAANTLESIVADVKVSFMTYPYKLVRPPVRYGRLLVASPLDIAIMKIGAVADRNTKKDFIDLFVFLEREQMTLAHLLEQTQQKFVDVNYDFYHVYKSLTYFAEADREAMPKMLIRLDWKKVKKFFVQEVKKLSVLDLDGRRSRTAQKIHPNARQTGTEFGYLI